MSRHPSGALPLFPDRCVAVLAGHRVAADIDGAVALCDEPFELLLILRRGEPMARHPSGTLALFPDRRVSVVVIDAVAAYLDRAIALLRESIEDLLVLG